MRLIQRNITTAFYILIALSFCNTAQAIPIMETLGVEVASGPGLGETGSIVVSYDSDDVPTGDETLDQNTVSLALTLFGQSFSNSNDVDFPGGIFPRVVFTGGTITFIDFVINETDADNPTAITDPRIVAISGGVVVQRVWQVGTSAPVPLPATAALFGIGLAGLGWSRRKKKIEQLA